MQTWSAQVAGASKGEVFKEVGRWRWRRNNGGIDTYHVKASLDDVRAHIAWCCLVEMSQVEFVELPDVRAR